MVTIYAQLIACLLNAETTKLAATRIVVKDHLILSISL
jgi:hypothetical protein